MPNYLLKAYDVPNGLEKRMATREAHMEFIRSLSKEGKVLLGGAILDTEGNMAGSVLFFSMTQEEFEQYQKDEPYIKAGVWGDVQIEETKFGEYFLENIANNYNAKQGATN